MLRGASADHRLGRSCGRPGTPGTSWPQDEAWRSNVNPVCSSSTRSPGAHLLRSDTMAPSGAASTFPHSQWSASGRPGHVDRHGVPADEWGGGGAGRRTGPWVHVRRRELPAGGRVAPGGGGRGGLRLRDAANQAADDLMAMSERAAEAGHEDEAGIFMAHATMAWDPALIDAAAARSTSRATTAWPQSRPPAPRWRRARRARRRAARRPGGGRDRRRGADRARWWPACPSRRPAALPAVVVGGGPLALADGDPAPREHPRHRARGRARRRPMPRSSPAPTASPRWSAPPGCWRRSRGGPDRARDRRGDRRGGARAR